MATNIFILKAIVFVVLIHFCQGKAIKSIDKHQKWLCKVIADKFVWKFVSDSIDSMSFNWIENSIRNFSLSEKKKNILPASASAV